MTPMESPPAQRCLRLPGHHALWRLAERWTCPRLRSFCLQTLRRRFGALQRTAPDENGALADGVGAYAAAFLRATWRRRRESADAAHVARLGGFDALSEGARTDIEFQLGLPSGTLQRTEQQICDAEADAAAIPERRLEDGAEPSSLPSLAAFTSPSAAEAAQRHTAVPPAACNVPMVGMALELLGLKSRSDLNGLAAILLRLPPKLEEVSKARWEVRVCRTGEQIRVLPDNVRRFGWRSMAEESWQWTWRGRLVVRDGDAGPPAVT